MRKPRQQQVRVWVGKEYDTCVAANGDWSEETSCQAKKKLQEIERLQQFRGAFVTCPHVKEEKARRMASTILPTSKQF
uniref:Uncharacterized protein n=1 Tax=Knipowitschia caucasica TaxID=637954 RepID=A0AAV2IR83_KNICA